MIVDLSCVGCGRLVVKGYTGGALAIACACGAQAPFLDPGEDRLAPPASFIRLITGRGRLQGPHWEYYLGYSDHESDLKGVLIDYLTQLGSISQADCPETRCQDAFRGGKARWKLSTSADKSASCAWCAFPIYLTPRQYLAVGHDRNARPLQCASCHRFTDSFDLSKVPVVILDEGG